MATYFEYKCKDCGHIVNASPKGKDMVMMGEVHHYLCSECKDIVNVLYPYGKKTEKVECPECGSDKLKKWNPKTGKCPKCGGDMKKTENILMVD